MNGYHNFMTSDDIYHALKDDILTLKLKPGQMLSENEVANNYSVSRTPVKTAFLRLKGEKYIEIVPQKGSYVTLLDIQYIRDIIYMRFVLEMDMLISIMEQGHYDGLIDTLKENLASQHRLVDSAAANPTDFYEIDSRFHYALFQHMGRDKMWDVIQDCQVYYTRFRILDTLTTARYQELVTEHENILDAFRKKDREALKKLIYDHLHGNLRTLKDKIEGEYKEYFIQH